MADGYGPRDAELGPALATRIARELGHARLGGNESLNLEPVARSDAQPERALASPNVGDGGDGHGKRTDAVLERALRLERERLRRDLHYEPRCRHASIALDSHAELQRNSVRNGRDCGLLRLPWFFGNLFIAAPKISDQRSVQWLFPVVNG